MPPVAAAPTPTPASAAIIGPAAMKGPTPKRYEGKVKDGNVLMSVHTQDSRERDRAKEIFTNAGAEDISYTGEEGVPNSHNKEGGQGHWPDTEGRSRASKNQGNWDARRRRSGAGPIARARQSS